jgi:amino acid transporter
MLARRAHFSSPRPANAVTANAPPQVGPDAGDDSPTLKYGLKRLFLGRPIFTERLEHERLNKAIALAVFSSDAMSSVAYGGEEMLRVLLPVVGLVAFSIMGPLTLVIIVVLAILVFSYRQTIKAYPSAGGAYIVTRDNFGLLPAQIAGVALLTDYVLTVAVSTAAGVQAITSIAPGLFPYRTLIALFFVWLIAYGNLLGVRESGAIFAAPTYLFILSIFSMIFYGVYRIAFGGGMAHLTYTAPPSPVSIGTAAVTTFIVLKAFASGGVALTGVEAISNGVPAFKKPEWRNAQKTMAAMGIVLGSSLIGVAYLAIHLHVLPIADQSKSVLAQVSQAVYGSSTTGKVFYLILQVATTLILVLAANTSFADFPRLASFHAGDAFLPRQFTKRGHRLVYSTGIIALAVAASVLLIGFKASVSGLIPLYALGVFTSFTLSQAGMSKRHLRLKEQGWRLGFAINVTGAIATGIILVVVTIVKFSEGAWMIVVTVPVLVTILVRVNHIYESEDRALNEGLDQIERAGTRRHHAVVVVEAFDRKTIHAIQYGLTAQPHELTAVQVVDDAAKAEVFRGEWGRRVPGVPLVDVPCPHGSSPARCVGEYALQGSSPEVETTVILPAPATETFWQRVRTWRELRTLASAPGPDQHLSVVVVRDHGGPGHVDVEGPLRILPRARQTAVILVERLDRSVLNAIEYARATGTMEVRALHAATDPAKAADLLAKWLKLGATLGLQLDMEDCPDRNIPHTVREYIEQLQAPDMEVTVIVPRRSYTGILQRLLHDRTSKALVRGLEGLAHVDVVTVPYHLVVEKKRRRPREDTAAH